MEGDREGRSLGKGKEVDREGGREDREGEKSRQERRKEG